MKLQLAHRYPSCRGLVTPPAGTTGTTVVGTYNTGTCFKMSGGILTKDGYTWYELNDGSAVSEQADT